jgi:hypothetical protein
MRPAPEPDHPTRIAQNLAKVGVSEGFTADVKRFRQSSRATRAQGSRWCSYAGVSSSDTEDTIKGMSVRASRDRGAGLAIFWLSYAFAEVVRRRTPHDSEVLTEVRRLQAEVHSLRAEGEKERFWTHMGVEATIIALGLAWLTFPRQSDLGQIEGAAAFAVALMAMTATTVRSALKVMGRPRPT